MMIRMMIIMIIMILIIMIIMIMILMIGMMITQDPAGNTRRCDNDPPIRRKLLGSDPLARGLRSEAQRQAADQEAQASDDDEGGKGPAHTHHHPRSELAWLPGRSHCEDVAGETRETDIRNTMEKTMKKI